MQTLKLNSKGTEVQILQSLLHLTPDGIFGPKTQTALIAFQRQHKDPATGKPLTPDGIVGAKTWAALGVTEANTSGTVADIKINYQPTPSICTMKSSRSVKYIVIHYTAGTSSNPGNALAQRKGWINRPKGKRASADFVVDDAEIVQINPDIAHYYCWSVGDNGGGKYIKNSNSVSIEICSNLKKGYSAAYPNHDGWYYTEASLNNALKLVKYLMKKYGISKDNVVRHYDVTKKYCPGILGWNTGSVLDQKTGKAVGKSTEEKWLAFKAKI